MGDHQQTFQAEEMATTSTAVTTVPPQLQEDASERVAVITLRTTAPKSQSRKKVVWTEDTVDNENMNKKKSKCCCIYEKPRSFGESDSEDSEDECEHCFGHVERRGQHQHQHHRQHAAASTQIQETPPESTQTVRLQEATPPPEAPHPQLPQS